MSKTPDSAALDAWYTLGSHRDFPLSRPIVTRLLGADLEVVRTGEGTFSVSERDTGRALPVDTAYGHVWVSLGSPSRPLFDLPEWRETDRRPVYVGAVRVRVSGLRVIENFLDLAPIVSCFSLHTHSQKLVEIELAFRKWRTHRRMNEQLRSDHRFGFRG